MILNNEKTIDVIIPVYNGEKFILDALRSATEQTLSPTSVIVVDDGSTDGTLALVSTYAELSIVPIKIISKENGGLSSARNAGIQESTADLVAFLDADDVWLPRKLEAQMRVYETTSYKNVALVYCNYNVINSEGVSKYTNYKVPFYQDMRGIAFKSLLERNKIVSSGSGVLIRRKVFNEVGYFDESLRFGEDWDMWLRIAEQYEVDFTTETLVKIRKNESNMTSDRLRSFKGELEFYRKWIPRIEKQYSIPMFWSDKIVYGILWRLPKKDFLGIFKEIIPKDHRKKLFRAALGSLLFYVPIFFIRRFISMIVHPNEIRIVIGLLKRNGR